MLADRNISSKFSMSPHHLISQLKQTKEGYVYRSIFILLEQNCNDWFQLLFRTKFRNEAKGYSKHLVSHLCEDHKEEALKMFLVENQELAKNAHWNSEEKNLCAKEKIDQDMIDEQPFP